MKKKKRKEMTEIRNLVKNPKEKSLQIANQVMKLKEIKTSSTVACFISFRSEVDTQPLIEHLWASHKNVVVPKVIGDTMVFYPITPDTNYQVSALGIKEPIQVDPIDEKTISSVIVPGLAFDQAGHRLGYGGGYYDKFLSTHNVTSIAIGFSEQIVNDIPFEPHDEIMDYVVTEKNIIQVIKDM